MKKKKDLEQEINEFLEYWDCNQMSNFLRDIIPLFELYNVEEDSDWVADGVGSDDVRNVRLIRTVYLISKIAEFHAGKLCMVNIRFKNIYHRLEKESAVKCDG
jgi:hypothetical protein